jgi:hypothetical protein
MNPSDDSKRNGPRKLPLTGRWEEDPACKLFRERVKAAREGRDIRFKEMATLTAYSLDGVQELEMDGSNPSLDFSFRVVRVLHLDLNQMLKDSAGGS